MSGPKTVFVVDDDAQVRASVCALLESMGCRAKPAASAEEFLASCAGKERGALIVDLRMPGMGGLELQEELIRRDWTLPVIILTAYARTPLTVAAMRRGAVTVIDKPCHDDDLWNATRAALEAESRLWAARQHRRDIEERIGHLTEAERRTMDFMVRGTPNKTIAKELGLALRTVEKRRHEIFAKTRARSLAELVELGVEARRRDERRVGESPGPDECG